MSKFDKLALVGSPWFFGVVLIICGFIIQGDEFLLLLCTGLICMSLFCVCSLLVKIVENKQN